MYPILLTLLVIDSLVLIAAVLMQSGKGSGLAANFGGSSSSSDSFVGTRQAANLLTRASWWCAGIFLVLAFILQILGARTRVPTSVLDPLSKQAPASATPAPAGAPAAAPAVPLTPVKPAPQSPAGTPAKPPQR